MTIYEYLEQSVTAYHGVSNVEKMLESEGFVKLNIGDRWELSRGKYYISPHPSVIYAFTIGSGINNIRIGMAHTDSPCLKIKPNPQIKSDNYISLNVEPYGGLIKSTWFDRPLAMAGKVIVKGDDVYLPNTILYDSNEPLFIIPSLAPHMRKAGEENKELDIQKELIPIASIDGKQIDENILKTYISNELDINTDCILDFDLFLYNNDKPTKIGLNKEFLSSPRLDNLVSVFNLTEAIIDSIREDGINMIALFDNEEIGSRSKQGADSMYLRDIICKIFRSLNLDEDSMLSALNNGYMLSVDGAHGVHPNYTEKTDPTNHICLGDGIIIKTSASQRYITDSKDAAVVMGLCENAGVEYKKQVNRSGSPGGQTLGPIATSYLPIRGTDIGVAMLAMHSANELCAIRDIEALKILLKEFYN